MTAISSNVIPLPSRDPASPPRLPMLPLWTDSYLNDTRGLSIEEHGAYLMLLMLAWRTIGGIIPNDDTRICRMLGITARKWAKLKPVVMSFWTLGADGWTQKRLRAEYQRATEKSEKARKSAGHRWSDNALSGKESHSANALPTQSEGISEGNALSSLTSFSTEKGVSAPKGFKSDLWKIAKGSVSRLTDKSEADAGKLIGRWVSQYDLGLVIKTIAKAEAAQPADPVPWITATLRAAAKEPAPAEAPRRLPKAEVVGLLVEAGLVDAEPADRNAFLRAKGIDPRSIA